MAKLTLTDLASLQNETSAIATLNANNTLLETALENTFSRNGTSPNAMGAQLDMNSFRIINLPAAVGDNDPVRLGDLPTGSTSVAWGAITGKPTSLAGLGISSVAWALITGTPTTLAGYGISPIAFSSLTGTPTSIAGYGINLTSEAISVTPTSNAITTLTSFTIQAAAASNTTREFMVNYGLTANTGYDGVGAGNKDKVAQYIGVESGTNSGDIWCQNLVINLKANLSHQINAQAIEIDFDNFYADYPNVSPTAGAISISNIGGYRNSYAMLVTGTINNAGVLPSWSMGLHFGSGSVRDYSILDQSSATYVIYSSSTRSNGIDFTNATLSGNAFASPGFIVKGSPTGGFGYAASAGGAVTQGTSRTTAVTLNKPTGAVTMFSAAGSATHSLFTVTNSTVAATDTVIVSIKSATNQYLVYVVAVNAGSFIIGFASTVGTAVDSPVINFAVIKAVST